MKTLAQRQLDRITRKAEYALMERIDFDPSRGGIGKVDRRYMTDDEADEIDAATDAAIAHAAELLGVAMPVQVDEAVEPTPPAFQRVKLGGV